MIVETAEGAKEIVVKKTMAVWQKFLLYPAVFAALFGAIPTSIDLYNAFKYDISYNKVKQAEEQRILWEKNFACTSTLLYQKVRTEKNTEVQVGACDNGDVLISIMKPDGQKVVQWVAIDTITGLSASNSWFVNKAFAASFIPRRTNTDFKPNRNNIHLAADKVDTICQTMIKEEAKISRIIKENGVCYGEIVQIMKGQVSKRVAVPCNTQCKAFFDSQKAK